MAPNPIKGRRRAHTRLWVYAAGAAGGAAVLALFVIVSGLIGGGDTKDPAIVVPVPRPAGLAQEGHVLGSASAPVTITEYVDFQ